MLHALRATPRIKVVVQIPCYNEAETLPAVLADIPRHIPGVDVVETLVIDDGSTDGTSEVARRLGVDHVIINVHNRGLARTFQTGIEHALAQGATVIVNTDGDNQYAGASIPDLVRPVLEGRADIAIGDRRPGDNAEFSRLKRMLQRVGSRVVRRLAGVDVADAVSGFRAYSRDAAFSINVMTSFSYTTETLIHAGQKGFKIVSVPVATNPTLRPSRLFKSMGSFLRKQTISILRSYVLYRSLSAFLVLGGAMVAIGLVPVVRFLYLYAIGQGEGHVQSLVLGGVFLLAGYITTLIAFLSDTISTNRRLTESILTHVRRSEQRLDRLEMDRIGMDRAGVEGPVEQEGRSGAAE